MRKRIVLGLILALVLLAALSAYVVLPVARELRAARAALAGPPADLEPAQVRAAEGHLDAAAARLDGPAAAIVRLVPVIGGNLAALEAVTDHLAPALDAALELRAAVDDVRRDGLIEDGRVRLEALAELEAPLAREVEALERLERELQASRGGTLLPPVWTQVDEVLRRTSRLLDTAEGFAELLDAAPGLLGEDEPRRYLVVLLNNAELRGAGGILAGVGSVVAVDGRLDLGRFDSVHDLQTDPRRTVPAPEEYERRYGGFGANTTLWLNTSYSPDAPDVGLVAARLYEEVTGLRTDGVITLDPRGLAALMPPGAAIEVPATDVELGSHNLARFVYSDSYELFRDPVRRRDTLLGAGAAVFRAVVDRGLGGEEALEDLGAAFGGGHIRFVSFEHSERAVLDHLGASGELAPPVHDAALVAVQNRGGGRSQGSKLDYWARRHLRHTCDVADDGSARCTTAVTLRNEVPEGLSRYVAGTPYGLLRSLVEVYVPAGADIVSVRRDDRSVEVSHDTQAGHSVIGEYVEVEPGSATTVAVDYDLPGSGSYALTVTPQPLARDATVELELALPEGWVAEGPGATKEGPYSFVGPLNRVIDVAASPDQRTGLAALWEDLRRFWNEPVF